MRHKKILSAIIFLISCIFMTSNFLSNTYARKLNSYSIYNSGRFGFGGSWDYQKNNDEENSITLVKCKKTSKLELTSPIDSYGVTRVGKDFSFVKQTENHHRLDKFMQGLMIMSIIMAPFAVMVNDSGRLDRVEYRDCYSNIVSVDLPKCIMVGENAFKNNENLVTVKLLNCKKIEKMLL